MGGNNNNGIRFIYEVDILRWSDEAKRMRNERMQISTGQLFMQLTPLAPPTGGAYRRPCEHFRSRSEIRTWAHITKCILISIHPSLIWTASPHEGSRACFINLTLDMMNYYVFQKVDGNWGLSSCVADLILGVYRAGVPPHDGKQLIMWPKAPQVADGFPGGKNASPPLAFPLLITLV